MPIMWTSNRLWLKLSFLSAGVVAAAVSTAPMQAQSGPPVRVGATTITGIPDDWSHRHVVFSSVDSQDQALQKGNYEHWQKVTNDPRYVIQQLKSHRRVEGPGSIDSDYREGWFSPSKFGKKPTTSNVKRDWSETLGTGTGLAAGHYPAKYGFSTTTTTCSDYVVYPTGMASSGTKATIVAFNSIYKGCPLYNNDPVVYWAYNTGGGTAYVATTSPVLSLDGTQVAYVQTDTATTTSQLVLLKMAASGGTVTTPVAPTSVTAANYRGCTAPCYYAVSLGTTDTNSAPFFDYTNDVIYVGDDSGKVHKLTGAFFPGATPALDPTNWPVTASSETSKLLYSPVLDSGSSGLIFVTDTGGYLHSFNPATPTIAALNSGRLENNSTNQFDSPVVDSTNEYVYVFVGYSGAGGHPSYINRFAAGSSISGSTGTGLPFPNTTGTTGNATGSRMFAGAFDNNYYNTYTTGHLYVCEDGVLYQVNTTAAFGTTPVVYNQLASTVGTATQTCSPVTEFLGVSASTTLNMVGGITASTSPITVASGTNIANNDYIQIDSEILKVTAGGGTTSLTVTRGVDGTTPATHNNLAAVQDVQDWIFTSVQANGSATGCTGACIYNYNVITEAASGTATAGFAAAGTTGGTSGIVIDSSSMAITGDAEVYYTLLGANSAAIQASQAGLQ
jgi:hypothetical protein